MSTIIFEDRPSDSPYVELIWRSRCERPGPFLSVALSRWQLVVWRALGTTYFTVRGPETHATSVYCPASRSTSASCWPPARTCRTWGRALSSTTR